VPAYELDGFSADIPRNAMLLDTNLLYERYGRNGVLRAEAEFFFDSAGPFLVPLCVVCEAWSMVVGKDRNWDGGFEMLRWLSTPPSVILVRDDERLSLECDSVCRRFGTDYVDSMLILLATRLSSLLGTPAPIATLDVRDFAKMKQAGTHDFAVYDVRSEQQW